MDAGLFEGMKKLLKVGKVQKELVDPYCTVQFAGHKGKTKVIRNEQDPEWNQQINLPIRVSCLSVPFSKLMFLSHYFSSHQCVRESVSR